MLHRHYFIHYALLLFLLLFGGILLILLDGHQDLQWLIMAALAVTFIIWAIWHHREQHSLTGEILLEYLAVLGIALLVLLLVSQ